MHLTLQFIGGVPERDLVGVIESVERLMRRGIYKGPLVMNWVAIGGGMDAPNIYNLANILRAVPDGAVLTVESSVLNVLPINMMGIAMGLHVRTVRRYVRHGRLPAVRIGKQYRVSREALDTLTGRAAAPVPAVSATAGATGQRHAEVSAVVHVDNVDAETARRIMTALPAAAKGKPDAEDPLRVDTIYDPARARLKVILNGSVTTTASLLGMLNLYLEA